MNFDPNFVYVNPGSWPNISVSSSFSVSISGGSWPSLGFTGPPMSFTPIKDWFSPNVSKLINKFEPRVCLAYENDWKSLLQMDIASLATFAARMELEAKCKDAGVTYGSKGADLPRTACAHRAPRSVFLPNAAQHSTRNTSTINKRDRRTF